MPRLTLEIVDIPEIICPEANEANEDDREPDSAAFSFLLSLAVNITDDFILNRPMHVDRITTSLIRFLRNRP